MLLTPLQKLIDIEVLFSLHLTAFYLHTYIYFSWHSGHYFHGAPMTMLCTCPSMLGLEKQSFKCLAAIALTNEEEAYVSPFISEHDVCVSQQRFFS